MITICELDTDIVTYRICNHVQIQSSLGIFKQVDDPIREKLWGKISDQIRNTLWWQINDQIQNQIYKWSSNL